MAVVEGDGALNELFDAMPLSLVPEPRPGHVVVLLSDVSVAQAARTLIVNNVYGCPHCNAMRSEQ